MGSKLSADGQQIGSIWAADGRQKSSIWAADRRLAARKKAHRAPMWQLNLLGQCVSCSIFSSGSAKLKNVLSQFRVKHANPSPSPGGRPPSLVVPWRCGFDAIVCDAVGLDWIGLGWFELGWAGFEWQCLCVCFCFFLGRAASLSVRAAA